MNILIIISALSMVYGQEINDQLNNEQFEPQINGQLEQNPTFLSGENEQRNSEQQTFVIQQQQHPQRPQHENIVVHLGNPTHEQVIVAQPVHNQHHHQHNQPQVIKIEVEEEHKHKPVDSHHGHPPHHGHHCQLMSRKGECTSIPNFFSCIRNGGVLAPAFTECRSFFQACCIRNFFSQ